MTMTLTLSKRSGLRDVALAVGAALDRHGIRAVLTGGACASIHSEGAYTSLDLDFILTAKVTQPKLDAAMDEVEFVRKGDRYVHPRARLWVEFPRGPLAVGGDYKIRPTVIRGHAGRVKTLSPTDSCRDRLAAYYHWNDRQSLEVAVQIALRHRLNMTAIRKWSAGEDHAEQCDEFRRIVRNRITPPG